MIREISAEIENLTEIARERDVNVRILKPEKIVVSQWVRFKCRYGCKGYGKHFGCPRMPLHRMKHAGWLMSTRPLCCSGSTVCQAGGRLALRIFRMTSMTGSGSDPLGERDSSPAGEDRLL